MRSRITVDDASLQVMQHVSHSERAAIFVGAHLGNWELAPKIGKDNGVPMVLIYRHANNPYVDALLYRLRRAGYEGLFPKGVVGAAKLIKALKQGNSIAMLVDQKMNDGIAVPFFGHPAMTAPATAQLAMKYRVSIIMARVVRSGGAHFKAQVMPPLDLMTSGDAKQDALAIMTQVNRQLEQWIREHPEQWFWVHKRWGEHKGE